VGNRSREIRELSIRNIGVIEEASITFGSGFNVITGETGAGKTMVLTGLNLLAGNRADADLVRAGKDRLTASALVAVEANPEGALAELIEAHDPEIEDGLLLLQRSITSEGKGKATLGSDPSTVTVLGSFASEFFTIHGQMSNHKLANNDYQRQILDRTSDKIATAHAKYELQLQALRTKQREIDSFRQALKERDREIAQLRRFLSDVERTKPLLNEWLELESTIGRLDSVEELRLSLSGALSDLDGEEIGALGRVASALRQLDQFPHPDDRHRQMQQSLKTLQVDLQELVRDLSGDLSALDIDPGDLDRLRERRAALKQFLQRNRELVSQESDDAGAIDALIHIFAEKERLLKDLEGSELRGAELDQELQKLISQTREMASILTRARIEAGAALSESVNDELSLLGLEKASFLVEVKPAMEDDFRVHGVDEIEFLFAAHGSGKPLPVHKSASGGELSRLMLAIELALSQHRDIGTLIFDEIDAGIGGETGMVIGQRLSQLAKSFQVIVITHLAQVAVWADKHFKIEKDDRGSFVLSSVVEVDQEVRVREVARMLSGQSDLEAAQVHALELLKHAGKS
jgi:DNA repair protein RecN (Recombination protein N)